MAMLGNLPERFTLRFTLFLALSVGAGAALAANGEDSAKATGVKGKSGQSVSAAGSKVTVTEETGKKTKVDVKSLPAQADHSGKKRQGKASFYSRTLAGKKMADGTPMNQNSNVAASKTLPIGTKAKVTNLKTGQSAVVEIRDRGPYVKGRIVDLSPKTAKDIGVGKDGVVPVEVAPIEVPQPDGSVKDGAALRETSPGGK